MEALLPWQQTKCAITQLYVSILSPYKEHMFLGTKCVTGLPGCYGNHCNYSNKRIAQ